MEEFPKQKSCGISTYDNWDFKAQISSIFHIDQASDGRMAYVLGVKVKGGVISEERKTKTIFFAIGRKRFDLCPIAKSRLSIHLTYF